MEIRGKPETNDKCQMWNGSGQ